MPLSLLLAVALSQGGGVITEGHAPLMRATYPDSLQFAPASGEGLPVVEDLCSALAAEVPTWATRIDGGVGSLCFGGEGTAAAGSIPVALTNEGGGALPAPANFTVCPNGPDCATKRGVSLNEGAASTAQSVDATAQYGGGTSFFVCAHYVNYYTNSYTAIVSNATSTGGVSFASKRFSMYGYAPLGGMLFSVYGAGGVEYGSSTTGFDMYEKPVFVCGAYQRIGEGTSRTAIWVNGTRVDTDNAAPLALENGATTTFGRFFVSSPAYELEGPLFGGLVVETNSTIEQLDAPIAAIARRVLADAPKGVVRGVPLKNMTYSRTGATFCSKASNTGSTLPPNRVCSARGGVLVEGSATNLVPRSQELTDASWVLYNSGGGALPSVTVNYALSPDSTKTAERLQPAAVTASQASLIYQGTSLSGCLGGATCTLSVFVKGTSTSGATDLCQSNGASATCTACAFTETAWTRCTHTANNGTGAALFMVGNAAGFPGSGMPARGAQDFLVWGAQGETGLVATSYTPTTSASATRGSVSAVLDTGITAPYPISLAATYTPWDGSNVSALKHFMEWYRSAGSRDALIISGAGNTVCLERGGSGCSEPIAYGAPSPKVRLVWRVDAANNSTHCIDTGTGSTCSAPVAAGLTQTSGTSMQLAPHFYSGGTQAPGSFYWSNVCVDPVPLRCGF